MKSIKYLLPIITIALTVTGCSLFSSKSAPITASPVPGHVKTPDTPIVATPAAVVIEEVEPTLHRDINNDGIVDSIFISEKGGSIFGGKYLTILDGKTKKEYSADNVDCYDAVIYIGVININEPSFAKEAQELLFSKEMRPALDPIGDWVVRANYNKRIYKNNANFDMVSKPKLVWGDNKSISSTNYCVKIPAAKASEYLKYRSHHQDEDFANASFTVAENSNSVWMVYCGYRFGKEPLKEVYRNDQAVIYANNHCIGIERDGKFAWLFATDGWLFGRIGEEGIDSLEVKDGVIRLALEAPKQALVDIETGKIASLKPYSEEDPYDKNGNLKPSIIKAFKAL